MREVEVKARIRDKDAIVRALEARGVVLSASESQNDRIYVRETGSLETFLANGLFLRLRTKSSGKTLFTAKYNPNRNAEQDMVAEEYETEVTNAESMERILALMGFTEAVRVVKERKSGAFGGYEFCLDEVEGLGSFIEVEKMVEHEEDVPAAHAELLTVLSELGIKDEDRFTKRYDVLLLENNLST
ncbi:MAG TPA: class IV adenylate cyclase [Candidatus Paceibacterota bacterium]|nr:class IV adenylate cyclase [Candidatus Paceibacterota bacterium]